MSNFFIILISCIVLFISIKLFKIASGGHLNIKTINMISFSFYNMIVFSFIGPILFALNMDNHYLAHNILNYASRIKGWIIVQLVFILFPLNIILINNLFKFNSKIIFQEYVKKKISYIFSPKDTYVFWPLFFISLLCVISIIYTFYNIGFNDIPIVKLLLGADSIELAKSRINVAQSFSGNKYIKNILALTLTPLISFIAYAYWKTVNTKKWRMLLSTPGYF